MLTLMTMSLPCTKMPWPPVASLIKPKLSNRAHNTTFTTPLPLQLPLMPVAQASHTFTLSQSHADHCLKISFCPCLSARMSFHSSSLNKLLPSLQEFLQTPPFLWSLSLRQWLRPFLSSQHVFHPCILYTAFLLSIFHVCLLNSTINYLEAGPIL